MENRDIFRIYLDSENAEITNDTTGNYTFNIRLPNRKVNYTNYVLYVDDFNICLKGLTTTDLQVKLGISQYNSYNSATKANNTVVATLFNPNTASARTDDLTLTYSGTNNPNQISSIPDNLNVEIVDIDNVGINLSNANNYWILNLRVEAFYD